MKTNDTAVSLRVTGSLYVKTRRPGDSLLRVVIWSAAILSTAMLVIIIGHILWNGLSHINWTFLTDSYSEFDPNHKGIGPMIINTLYVVLITLLISAPLGIASSIYLTQYAKQGRLVKSIRFGVETLSGIPSIIYGLFGFAVFVQGLRLGYSILAGCLTMTICILPTIIRTTEEALLSVPGSYKEGALALGATKLRVVMGIVLPSALPGVLTAVILAMGRIVGETAALWFTVGASGYDFPSNALGHILEPGRTLSLHLYQSAVLGYDPITVPYATASVLLILVFILNRLANLSTKILQRGKK